ncbi:MAG: hypothetical protein U0Q19_20535 [Kineosporiaceae bacterium]
MVLDYLFLDASFFRMHPGSPAERPWPRGGSPPTASRSSSVWHPDPGESTGARADF